MNGRGELERDRLMKHLIAWCCLGLLCALFIPAHGQDKPTLRLVQTIPLPGVSGRLDHMAIDLAGKRLFVAAVTNETLEVLDLDAGKVVNSIPGIKGAQDALFLGGQFNKLYVSSLDGTVRIFQGESFRSRSKSSRARIACCTMRRPTSSILGTAARTPDLTPTQESESCEQRVARHPTSLSRI
jgi:hypothetical protein